MNKPKMDFNGRKTEDKIQRSYNLLAMMEGNPNFPTPTPPLAEVRALLEKLEVTYQESLYGDRMKKGLASVLEMNLDIAIRGLLGYVDGASAGDASKILSSGFELRNLPAAAKPVAVPGAPVVTPGSLPGHAILKWSPINNARGYLVQVSHDLGETWEDGGIYSQSRITLKDLPVETKPWFRVATYGSLGQSNWSEVGIGKVAG